MERAYEIEFDRKLNLIRLDYGIGLDAQALLGGDLLKRDIDAFTLDYLQNAQKKNPVRALVSLRDQFPAEFATFINTGILPFRTDLELLDRVFPGSYRRKIKKIEMFVEGLVPVEGAVGILTNEGIVSEWRASGASWAKFTRVMNSERMILSSYQFRRDVTVFQPSEEMLGLFENMGPQCNWTLELPKSANNLDYSAIDDVKFAMYFDSDFSDSLRTFLKTFYPATGGRSTVLSARFQFPDEYFRLNTDRRIAFSLNQSYFAFNYEGLKITSLGIRLLPISGPAIAGAGVTVTRKSDNSAASGTTDATGTLKGDPATMAPFAAWKNSSPLDTFTVSFANGVDVTKISDVQLFFSYAFTYRADG
jgi:Tc toxin complex TcA C-terminal TcB-binding domain